MYNRQGIWTKCRVWRHSKLWSLMANLYVPLLLVQYLGFLLTFLLVMLICYAIIFLWQKFCCEWTALYCHCQSYNWNVKRILGWETFTNVLCLDVNSKKLIHLTKQRIMKYAESYLEIVHGGTWVGISLAWKYEWGVRIFSGTLICA